MKIYFQEIHAFSYITSTEMVNIEILILTADSYGGQIHSLQKKKNKKKRLSHLFLFKAAYLYSH